MEYYIESVTTTGVTNSWPALADTGGGVLAHAANALYQVDNSTYNGGQPIYRIIMTQAERLTLAQIVSSDRNSDAQMNSTFITIDGTSSESRYLTGVRIRGAGSRGVSPPNLRVNIPSDRRWKDVSAINLNTQFTHAQVAGFALAARSGLNTDTTRAVQGIEGTGRLSNCGRTNKDGVDFVKAATPGYERYIALYQTPQDQGGCSGCRFFIFCKGQCPGTAMNGDWRNKTEHCDLWMTRRCTSSATSRHWRTDARFTIRIG